MDVNRATIVGRLTRDPEVRTTPSGINVTSFGVATNFIWNDPEGNRRESVEYHNVVAWRKLGEIVAQYLRKGRRVLVEGRLQTRTWEGQDGAKRNRTEIIADNVIMLDSRTAQETAPSSDGEIAIEEPIAPKGSPTDSSAASAPAESAEEISVEDIPF